ncbi:MAG: hypothetical protein K2W95_21325 [Candidatus Obscuribacterales bacterium]|nr:hypothetical protein [Candidatus Obscuribacterales bacterium]
MSLARSFVEEFELGPWSSGPLSGLTMAVSDGIDIEERVTGCGNTAFLEGRALAASNAISVDLLLSSGAQCLGKARVTELAFTRFVEASAAPPLNGLYPERLIGGGSPGIASAVSCKLVDFGFGIDAAGSLIQSAASCGLTGWKASYGVISGAGHRMIAPSFDAPGVLSSNPETVMKVATALLCQSGVCEFSKPGIVVLADAASSLDKISSERFRLAVEQIEASTDCEVSTMTFSEFCPDAGVSSLEELGDLLDELFGLEVWTTYGHWIDSKMPQIGEESKQKLFASRHLDRAQLPSLLSRRGAFFDAISRRLQRNSPALICIPTAPVAITKAAPARTPDRTRHQKQTSMLAAIASLAGLPQVTLPLAQVDAAALGVSLIAGHRQDVSLLRFACGPIARIL